MKIREKRWLSICFLLPLLILLFWLGRSDGRAYASAARQPTPTTEEEAQPTQPVVVRIYFETRAKLARLHATIDVWEEALSTQPYVTAQISPATVAALRAEGFRVVIDVAQTARMNSAEHFFGHSRQAEAEALVGINAIPNYTCYRTVEETHISLATLAADHPTLATWTDIGDSWDAITPGGNPGYDLFALKLTNSAVPGPKPKLMLIAAIHAREYATAELATRYGEHLVNNYGIDADITWLLDHSEIHILPQVNPDGRKIAENGISWRKNTNPTNGCGGGSYGVDLNRNSSFRWAGSGFNNGSSTDPCSFTYRGPAAASEPEVQTIENYARTLFPDQRGPSLSDAAPATTEGVFISLHSYAQLVLYPWGWNSTPPPNLTALTTLGRKFGYFNGYGVCNVSQCLYLADGTTDDFTYGELGVASYTFEVGTDFFQSCATFETQIYPDNLQALLYAAKAARRPYQVPAGPDATNLMLSATPVDVGTTVTLTAMLNDTRSDSNGYGSEPTQAIQAVRYTIDKPAWISGTTHYPMGAIDGLFDTSIEPVSALIATTGLSSGTHTIFVEGQDAAGNWGVPTAIFLEIHMAAVQPGNCNGDGVVDAGDISAIVLEIFDGDGAAVAGVTGGTFPGGPGCDANGDTQIDAADLTCTVLHIFDPAAGCSENRRLFGISGG